MKFDVCMWAKNGGDVLPIVLKRIDAVVPRECVGKKIFVDDSSVDQTVKIARDFGWSVYKNRLGWISGGTQEALRHVDTELFASVEQDVVLTKNFMSLFKHFEDPKTAVACGVYYPTVKYGRIYFKHHIEELGKNGVGFIGVGSNFYRTKVVKESGFVTNRLLMLSFYNRIQELGYKWVTDYSVVSEHIRKSFWEDLSHLERNYLMSDCKDTIIGKKGFWRSLLSVFKSPLYLRTGNPLIPPLEFFTRMKLLQIYLKNRVICGFEQ
jgi:glycosyltransferase involved in cell wall biosynthesis